MAYIQYLPDIEDLISISSGNVPFNFIQYVKVEMRAATQREALR